jgi:hypothetical protein
VSHPIAAIKRKIHKKQPFREIQKKVAKNDEGIWLCNQLTHPKESPAFADKF